MNNRFKFSFTEISIGTKFSFHQDMIETWKKISENSFSPMNNPSLSFDVRVPGMTDVWIDSVQILVPDFLYKEVKACLKDKFGDRVKFLDV